MYSKLNAKQQAKTASSATRPDVSKILANLHGPRTSEVSCYNEGAPIFASMTREFPGPYALWDFIPTKEDGVYTIKNVGLDCFIVARDDGTLVVARGSDPTEFRVQPADEGFVLMKLKDEDKVWTLGGYGVKRDVVLDGANGSFEQKFTQIVVEA